MNTQYGLERCLSFINCQLQPPGSRLVADKDEKAFRAVTISRQTGAGSHVVAEKLAEYLQPRSPKGSCPWTIFDRNLVEQVLKEHNLPERMARFLAEDRISEIGDTIDELFGLHPPSWTLVRQVADTILHLVELGNVIIVGRGGQIITSHLDFVLRVRLVGSLERRLEHVQEHYKLGRKAALDFIHVEDRGRRRYLKKYFGKEIEDPLLYHLIINTDAVSYDQTTRIIGEAILNHRKG
jgi:cytidylate kinase